MKEYQLKRSNRDGSPRRRLTIYGDEIYNRSTKDMDEQHKGRWERVRVFRDHKGRYIVGIADKDTFELDGGKDHFATFQASTLQAAIEKVSRSIPVLKEDITKALLRNNEENNDEAKNKKETSQTQNQ